MNGPCCNRGVVKVPEGEFFRYQFCVCDEGVAASQRPCTCPTLADLVPGFGDMLEELAASLPSPTPEEQAFGELAAAWRRARTRNNPACPECSGNKCLEREPA